MTNNMRRLGIFALVGVMLLGLAQPGYSRGISDKDRIKIRCAMQKMLFLAEMFDVRVENEKKKFQLPKECTNTDKPRDIIMPKWFPEELTRMDSNKVVYVPNEGTYSEVDLWRQAFSNVYLFLDRADKSLDPNIPIVLDQLSRGYVGNATTWWPRLTT